MVRLRTPIQERPERSVGSSGLRDSSPRASPRSDIRSLAVLPRVNRCWEVSLAMFQFRSRQRADLSLDAARRSPLAADRPGGGVRVDLLVAVDRRVDPEPLLGVLAARHAVDLADAPD